MTVSPQLKAEKQFLLLAVLVVYSLAYLLWMLTSPLGQAPQLDSRELLLLARSMAAGELPAEPFFRAMGYPLLLVPGALLFSSLSGLAGYALLLGAVCHVVNAWLVGWLAARLWTRPAAGTLAALLFGLNPVVLFFSVDVLDMAPGLTTGLGSLVWLWRGLEAPTRRSWRYLGASGLLLGLAVVIRPHFLALAPVLAVVPAVAGHFRLWSVAKSSGWAAACLLPIALQAFAGWQLSGQWQWMPWQGPFNLYAANAPGDHGKYFTQRVVVVDRGEGLNPARAESVARYLEASGDPPPPEIDAMNAYWRERFRERVMQEPLDWLGQLARKTYFLLNDFEQYNNKTYAYHAGRNPLLGWNPLSWGVMLCLAVGGLIIGWPAARRGRLTAALALIATYAAGVVLFYVSARFRFPLVAGLAVLAGGWTYLLPVAQANPQRLRWAAGAMLLAAVVSFSTFANVSDRSTFIQDEMLLANAAAEVGKDRQAYEWALSASRRDASRLDARRLAVISFVNWKLSDPSAFQADAWGVGKELLPGMEALRLDEPALDFAVGVFLWNLGREDLARDLWTLSLQHFGEGAVASEAALRYARGDGEALPADLVAAFSHLLKPARGAS